MMNGGRVRVMNGLLLVVGLAMFGYHMFSTQYLFLGSFEATLVDVTHPGDRDVIPFAQMPNMVHPHAARTNDAKDDLR